MKLTEELLLKAGQIPNFSDGVILPDGDYRLIEEKWTSSDVDGSFAISGKGDLENDPGERFAAVLDDRKDRLCAYRL